MQRPHSVKIKIVPSQNSDKDEIVYRFSNFLISLQNFLLEFFVRFSQSYEQ